MLRFFTKKHPGIAKICALTIFFFTLQEQKKYMKSADTFVRQEIEKIPRYINHHFVFPQDAAQKLRSLINVAQNQRSPLKRMYCLESCVSFSGPNRLCICMAIKHLEMKNLQEATRNLKSIDGFRYDIQNCLENIIEGRPSPSLQSFLKPCPFEQLRNHDLVVCELFFTMSKTSEMLDNHILCVNYALVAIKGSYDDWILNQTRESREFCIAAMLHLGLYYLRKNHRYHLGVALLVFACFSSKSTDKKMVLAILEEDKDDDVNLFIKALKEGPDAYCADMIQICRERFHCNNCLIWIGTALRSPFVEWMLQEEKDNAVSPWPHQGSGARRSVQAMFRASEVVDDSMAFISLQKALMTSFTTLRYYDMEIRTILTQMADLHARKGKFDKALIYFRECLRISYLRSIVLPDSCHQKNEKWKFMGQIVKTQTNVLRSQTLSEQNKNMLALSLVTLSELLLKYTEDPVFHLTMALALFHVHGDKAKESLRAWSKYYERRKLSCDSYTSDIPEWEDEVQQRFNTRVLSDRDKNFKVDVDLNCKV